MKKKIIAIILLIAVLISGVIIYEISKSKKDNQIIEKQTKNVEQEAETKVYTTESVKAVIYLPNNKGNGYKKEEVQFTGKGTEIQNQILTYVMQEFKKSSIMSVPGGTKILDMKIWDETLQINFSKGILNSKVKNKKYEKYIIGSMVNSMLSSSKEFTDVQFLVEGKKTEHFLGYFNTLNPFMSIQ